MLFVVTLMLSAAACGGEIAPPPTETPTSQPVATSTQSPTFSPAPTITASPTPTPQPPQKTSYTLDALLDYDLHQLQVSEKIHYINKTTDRLSELLLMVDTLYYPGTFNLQSLTWGNGQAVAGVQQEAGWLRFPLLQPLEPGQPLDLSLAYQLDLPSPQPNPTIRPIPFGYTERQTNLVDWYPFVPPYVPGQGWLAHRAGYYGEHLVYEIADFDVTIRLAQPNPNLTLAASSPAIQEGAVFRFQHNDARNFVWSISPYYQALTAQAGTIKVTSYAFGGQEAANQAVLNATVEAIELYTRLFGPYPRSELTVVEADFLDGMEYDGLYFLSKGFYNLYTGAPAEYLVAIAVHETAHQWWYAGVGNDQALEPWLDEALCTYSEKLYYENVHPEGLDWWWAYRVNYYQPRGWVDTSIYNPHGESEPYRAYRDAIYLNGAVFLEELRQTVSDETFFRFIKNYNTQYTLQIATAQDFFTLVKQLTQTDLQPLLKKYFYQYQ